MAFISIDYNRFVALGQELIPGEETFRKAFRQVPGETPEQLQRRQNVKNLLSKSLLSLITSNMPKVNNKLLTLDWRQLVRVLQLIFGGDQPINLSTIIMEGRKLREMTQEETSVLLAAVTTNLSKAADLLDQLGVLVNRLSELYQLQRIYDQNPRTKAMAEVFLLTVEDILNMDPFPTQVETWELINNALDSRVNQARNILQLFHAEGHNVQVPITQIARLMINPCQENENHYVLRNIVRSSFRPINGVDISYPPEYLALILNPDNDYHRNRRAGEILNDFFLQHRLGNRSRGANLVRDAIRIVLTTSPAIINHIISGLLNQCTPQYQFDHIGDIRMRGREPTLLDIQAAAYGRNLTHVDGLTDDCLFPSKHTLRDLITSPNVAGITDFSAMKIAAVEKVNDIREESATFHVFFVNFTRDLDFLLEQTVTHEEDADFNHYLLEVSNWFHERQHLLLASILSRLKTSSAALLFDELIKECLNYVALKDCFGGSKLADTNGFLVVGYEATTEISRVKILHFDHRGAILPSSLELTNIDLAEAVIHHSHLIETVDQVLRHNYAGVTTIREFIRKHGIRKVFIGPGGAFSTLIQKFLCQALSNTKHQDGPAVTITVMEYFATFANSLWDPLFSQAELDNIVLAGENLGRMMKSIASLVIDPSSVRFSMTLPIVSTDNSKFILMAGTTLGDLLPITYGVSLMDVHKRRWIERCLFVGYESTKLVDVSASFQISPAINSFLTLKTVSEDLFAQYQNSKISAANEKGVHIYNQQPYNERVSIPGLTVAELEEMSITNIIDRAWRTKIAATDAFLTQNRSRLAVTLNVSSFNPGPNIDQQATLGKKLFCAKRALSNIDNLLRAILDYSHRPEQGVVVFAGIYRDTSVGASDERNLWTVLKALVNSDAIAPHQVRELAVAAEIIRTFSGEINSLTWLFPFLRDLYHSTAWPFNDDPEPGSAFVAPFVKPPVRQYTHNHDAWNLSRQKDIIFKYVSAASGGHQMKGRIASLGYSEVQTFLQQSGLNNDVLKSAEGGRQLRMYNLKRFGTKHKLTLMVTEDLRQSYSNTMDFFYNAKDPLRLNDMHTDSLCKIVTPGKISYYYAELVEELLRIHEAVQNGENRDASFEEKMLIAFRRINNHLKRRRTELQNPQSKVPIKATTQTNQVWYPSDWYVFQEERPGFYLRNPALHVVAVLRNDNKSCFHYDRAVTASALSDREVRERNQDLEREQLIMMEQMEALIIGVANQMEDFQIRAVAPAPQQLVGPAEVRATGIKVTPTKPGPSSKAPQRTPPSKESQKPTQSPKKSPKPTQSPMGSPKLTPPPKSPKSPKSATPPASSRIAPQFGTPRSKSERKDTKSPSCR